MARIITPDDIPTMTLMFRLGHFTQPVNVIYTPQGAFNDRISLVQKDITTLRVDAIVNAANMTLCGGGGVDGSIHKAAGKGLLEECSTLDGCDTGSAKITGAYDLPCDKVIHAVGPVWDRAGPDTAKLLLQGCYHTSLDLASVNGCKSIAFPAISTGIFGYPPLTAAQHAIEAVRKWLDQKGEGCGGIERIIFCCFEDKDRDAYLNWLPHFFPPTPQDVPAHSEQDPSTQLVQDMPDPPTTEPTDRDAPPLKVQKKTAPESSSPRVTRSRGNAKFSWLDGADDWVAVEKPPYSDVNGYIDEIDDRRSTSIDDTAMTQEEKEQANAALHTAQQGGDSMQNYLERDW